MAASDALSFPDWMLQDPGSGAVLFKKIPVIEFIDYRIEFSLSIAAELAEISYAEGIETAVMLFHQLNGLIPRYHSVADKA